MFCATLCVFPCMFEVLHDKENCVGIGIYVVLVEFDNICCDFPM